jgi:hypothetical protein
VKKSRKAVAKQFGATSPAIRTFESGAVRHVDFDKIDFEAHLSPLALDLLGRYMHKHRPLSDGGMRDPDNWQRGIPLASYVKSMWRHFMALWRLHRGWPADEALEDAVGGLMFNVLGYAHQIEKARIEAARARPAS